MKLYDQLIQFVEQKLGPIAGKLGAQRHITALRDGFLVAMPFIIVGSFILILPTLLLLPRPQTALVVPGWTSLPNTAQSS